jgi:hypothetical protein
MKNIAIFSLLFFLSSIGNSGMLNPNKVCPETISHDMIKEIADRGSYKLPIVHIYTTLDSESKKDELKKLLDKAKTCLLKRDSKQRLQSCTYNTECGTGENMRDMNTKVILNFR